MVQDVLGKGLGLGMGQVLAQPFGVEAHLVHADEADGGEVVFKGSQIVLGIGVEARVHQPGDDGALGLEAPGGDVHDVVQPLIEFLRGLAEIGDPGQIDGDHAHGAGGLAGAEVTAGLFAQFPQVQPQPAAHGAHVARLHIGVDVIGEVRRAVLGGHGEEQTVVLRVGPVKVLGNGVGGDGILEAPAVGVALGHDLDERLVHHVHFLLAVAVGEILLLAAHDGGQVLQVLGNGPVQGDIGERCLSAPAGGGVHAEDKGLDALLDLFLGQVVRLDEGGEVCIEGRKGLGTGPLVLHDAQEIDHLVAEGGEVAGGGGVDLPWDAKALLDQLLQAPAGAVAGEHGEIVEVDVAVPVGLGDLLVIDLTEPVVGGDGAGVGEDQSAHGIGDGGVLLDPPVVDLEVVVYQRLVIQQGGAQIADLFPLLAVEDIGLGNVGVACLAEDVLHAVLDLLHGDPSVVDLVLVIGSDLQRQQVDDVRIVLFVGGLEGLGDGSADLGEIKLHDLAVPLDNLIHVFPASSLVVPAKAGQVSKQMGAHGAPWVPL